MTPEQWRKVEELFQAALEREPGEREAFLEQACRGQPDLRREVESLLECSTSAAEAVAGVVSRAAESLEAEAAPVEGRRIGIYQVVREIGRGGMGQVYLATRVDGAYQQRVAIKVVKRGMDTDLLLDRFRQERQILASLEHPNIARLLDGGATEDGRPYLVMEYVDGESITAYAGRHELGERRRLELFRQVCAAVQYAHQNLVVHRDLKPGNILVTAEGVPKLLDFGVAKLLRPQTEDGEATATLTVLGAMTPQYASPEQVEGRPITTATDVYALGAILYELLSGEKAHVFQTFTEEEIRRVVCADAPGTRLAGDLGNIVRMAMRKEPQRRYSSVEQFSEDLQRYLEGRPVRARPDTLGYRTGMFVRRNKLGVAAGLVVSTLVVGFSVSTALQAARIRKERDKAQQVTQFLLESFRVADPGESRGNTVTAREILDRGLDKVSRELSGQPEVQASLMDTMGQVYSSLGLYEKAALLFRQAVDLRRRELGPESVELAASLNHLGDTLRIRGEYGPAEPLLREALAIERKVSGRDNPNVAGGLRSLGLLFSDKNDFRTAEPLLRESLDMYRKVSGEGNLDTATTREALAQLLSEKNDDAGAEPLLRAALASYRTLLGRDHLRVAGALDSLGRVLDHKGDAGGAEQAYREALALRRKILGEDHPAVGTTLTNLALVLSTAGDVAQAEPLYRQALAIHVKSLGAAHPAVAVDRNNLALLLVKKGDRAGAEREFRDVLEAHRKTHSRDNPETARFMINLAGVLLDQGKLEEAASMYQQALGIQRQTLPPSNPEIGISLAGRGRVLTAQGRPAEAEALLREALAIQTRALPAGHWRIADTQSALGGCLTELRRFEEAEPLLVPSYKVLLDKRGARDYRVETARKRVDRLYRAWGKTEIAARYR